MKYLSMIEHLNLISLYGYQDHGKKQIILVEYINSGTLGGHVDRKSSNYNL